MLEDEFDELIVDVATKRRQYPRRILESVIKTLKAQHESLVRCSHWNPYAGFYLNKKLDYLLYSTGWPWTPDHPTPSPSAGITACTTTPGMLGLQCAPPHLAGSSFQVGKAAGLLFPVGANHMLVFSVSDWDNANEASPGRLDLSLLGVEEIYWAGTAHLNDYMRAVDCAILYTFSFS